MTKFKMTAYGRESGKDTYSGVTLANKNIPKFRYLAVDPKVIEIGSKVWIDFSGDYDNLDSNKIGEYRAVDTGSAIRGNKLDLFLGWNSSYEQVKEFGIKDVEVTKIERPEPNWRNNAESGV